MHAKSSPRATGYADGPITKAPNWHGLVVWDVWFNGMTTGLFLATALCELADPDAFAAVAKIAYPVALVLLLIDLLLLVLDLGDPLRFHHMLRMFKLSSPMSLGTWCLTIYSLPLTAAVLLNLLPSQSGVPEWIRMGVVVSGLLPALGSAVYKGVLFSTSAQPGWRDARWLGGYLVNSALILGCAQLLALAWLLDQQRAIAVLRPALGLLLVLSLAPQWLLFSNLRPILARLRTRKSLVLLGVLALAGGVLLPLCLLGIGRSPFLLLPAVVLIFLAALLVRFEIVWLPHRSH